MKTNIAPISNVLKPNSIISTLVDQMTYPWKSFDIVEGILCFKSRSACIECHKTTP